MPNSTVLPKCPYLALMTVFGLNDCIWAIIDGYWAIIDCYWAIIDGYWPY